MDYSWYHYSFFGFLCWHCNPRIFHSLCLTHGSLIPHSVEVAVTCYGTIWTGDVITMPRNTPCPVKLAITVSSPRLRTPRQPLLQILRYFDSSAHQIQGLSALRLDSHFRELNCSVKCRSVHPDQRPFSRASPTALFLPISLFPPLCLNFE